MAIRKNIEPAASSEDVARARVSAADLSPELQVYNRTLEKLAKASARVNRSAASSDVGATAAATVPPSSNTGGNYREAKLVAENGSVFEVPARRGWGGDSAFVDWVNFTVHEVSFMAGDIQVTDEDVIKLVSMRLFEILGFGITSKRDGGMNFYKSSYVLGEKWGFVCHGGQRDTVLVQLNGAGCAAAREGWELRLQTFLEEGATNGRITRIDLAMDDFDGRYVSVDSLESSYDAGMFKGSAGGRNPDIELRGNWKNPNGKGRTIYVGNRANGKFFRGYEKGCQLGSPSSKWVRCEVEFKSVDRIIPFDALTRAGEYLAAAYPALAWVSERQERILTVQKTVQVSYARTVNWLRHQCGAAIDLLMNMETDAASVVSMIRREGKLPRGVEVPDYQNSGSFIHDDKPEQLPFEAFVDWSFNL